MTPVPSAAFSADGSFDESKLAKPSDWAALDDFDEDAIIAQMSSRVEETWLAAKEEIKQEKKLEKKGSTEPVAPRSTEPAASPSIAAAAPVADKRPAAACVSAVSSSGGSCGSCSSGGSGCAMCGAIAAKLKRCTACKSVSYCTRECQQQHWPQHKLECKLLQQQRAQQPAPPPAPPPAAPPHAAVRAPAEEDLAEIDVN